MHVAILGYCVVAKLFTGVTTIDTRPQGPHLVTRLHPRGEGLVTSG